MALRNLRAAPSQRFGALNLFLDDLAQLQALVTATNCRLRYRHGDLAADDLADLKSLRHELGDHVLNKLTIDIRPAGTDGAGTDGMGTDGMGTDGWITLQIGDAAQAGNLLEIDGDGLVPLGQQILDFLKSRHRSRLVQFFYADWTDVGVVIFLGVICGVLYLTFLSLTGRDLSELTLPIVAVVILLRRGFSALRGLLFGNCIYLYERRTQPRPAAGAVAGRAG